MPEPLRILSHLPEPLLARVREAWPEAEIHAIPQSGPLPEDAHGEVLLTFTWGSENLAEAMDRGVRWVHCFGTGVDAFRFELLGDATLSCSRGASAVPISEWTLAMLLTAAKQLPGSWIDAPPERWNFAELGGLEGTTLGLVGFGAIAQAIAERALAFGMRLRAYRRSGAPSPIEGVEVVDSLDRLLAEADHVVVAASSTPETRHLIDRRAFAAMKPGAHLVNIARGALVDQEALREALDSGRLALASLDVAEPEPLPAGHWLYTHPRVRLSPHISWSAPGALERLLEPFLDNLGRWQRGEPLTGRVEPERGY